MGKSVWMVKIRGMNAGHLLGIEIMGACFQAPHCHTWTRTNGNALCSLMNFVFQHVTLTRSYNVNILMVKYRLAIVKIYAQNHKKSSV